MTTKPTDTAAPASADLAAIEREALADMTPRERIAYEMQKATLEVQRAALRVAEDTHRRATNEETVGREHVRTNDEAHTARAVARKAARARLSVALIMDKMQGFPLASVTVTAQGHIAGAGEPYEGQMMLAQLSEYEFGVTEKALQDECLAPFKEQMDEAAMMGQPTVADTLRSKAMGNGPEAFKGRRWVELQRPVMQRLLSGPPLADLISSGVCKLVGEIEVSDEPIRTAIDLQ